MEFSSQQFGGSEFVRKNGYILMCQYSGHKMFWWDHDKWLERQSSFTQEFWDDYREHHKGTGDYVAQEVREHFQAASKWDRMALNAPTQGELSIALNKLLKFGEPCDGNTEPSLMVTSRRCND